jgi:hypothetical protein
LSSESKFEPLDAFSAFDNNGRAHEVQVWAAVTYSTNDSGQTVRSLGMKQLRMAGSGSLVHAHLDGSLEDSETGLRMRMSMTPPA